MSPIYLASTLKKTSRHDSSSETLSGVTTVRAMAAVPRFVRENEELVEASLRTTYSGQVEEEMMIICHDDRLS